jgi:UDPglucose 6-dehydrogenase
LLVEGVSIRAHDPEAIENVRRIMGDKIQYFETPYDAAEGADAIFISTEWPEFRTPDFEKLNTILKGKVIFDGRNLYDLDLMKDQGYSYFSIGREVINGK